MIFIFFAFLVCSFFVVCADYTPVFFVCQYVFEKIFKNFSENMQKRRILCKNSAFYAKMRRK